MKSAWVERDATAAVDRYGKTGVAADLALRIYSTQLIGRDARLVLHGGGNSSLKTRERDLAGEEATVLRVKGTGWDMGTIEPAGFPAVRLEPLRKLRAQAKLSDDEAARAQRAFLLDPQAPSPSVETLLHAFLPAKYIDHTHAMAVLALIDQANSESLCAEVFGWRLGFVPYQRPGFGLAKATADVFDTDRSVEGLILDKHGIFTFGDDARQAYERMIEMVTLAERRLAKGRAAFGGAAPAPRLSALADIAPIVRGACTLRDADGEGAHRRPLLDFRASDDILAFVNGKDVARYACAGVVTPDHVIRTKPWPLILRAPEEGKLEAFKQTARAAVETFAAGYTAYFERNKARTPGATMHDPMPRIVLVPGLGLFGLGPTAKDARIAADLAESAIDTITGAEAIGAFNPVGERDMFDCEYWPQELAKLSSRKRLPLEGQVAVITGAAGAIGAATAEVFAQAGAAVALLDIDAKAAQAKAAAIGGASLALDCDVTELKSVRRAFDDVVRRFGGVDIVVSNAGAAWQGRIGEVEDSVLRASFEINFFAHQTVAQAAVAIMRAQGTGGCLLFNVSKQAVNPGANFGPYGLPKAATLFLVRQYALDYGADGIRANAVNADRVRSGLLSDDLIRQRAKARGIGETEYMSGNLLGREVTAQDVAQALALKTTADVTTVDGGNIAAALR